jgi:MFS family permease
VTARTAFSLLLPPLTAEFGWDRGLVAGAFSFGFLVSAILSPTIGRVMDSHGPRVVIGGGVCLLSVGLFLVPLHRDYDVLAGCG